METIFRKRRIGGVAIALLSLIIGLVPAAAADHRFSSIRKVTGSEPPARSSSVTTSRRTDRTAPVAGEPDRRESFGKLPLIFEENRGQADSAVKFLAHRKSYDLLLSNAEAVLSTRQVGASSMRLSMKFVGADRNPAIEGEVGRPGVSNYYQGNNPSQWITSVPHFGAVRYRNLYTGIDLRFHDGEGLLEYDFIVAPNADPNAIRLDFNGADEVSLDQAGDLLLRVGELTIRHAAPVIYQESAQGKRSVSGKFVLLGEKRVGFSVAEFDRDRTLVIDPKISYLTYVGGSDFDEVDAIATDTAGNAYLSGGTKSLDFPAPGARPERFEDAVFVAKLDPTGHSLLYLTYLDGEDIDGNTGFEGDAGNDLVVDANGNAYTTGTTFSDRFPTTPGAFQTRRSTCGPTYSCAFNNTEAFVTKLDSRGQIVFSSYLGGRKRDNGNGIAVDGVGRVYVVGYTESGATFPVKNEFQSTGVFGQDVDAFLTVFNADGTDISYSTGLGGREDDFALDIALDPVNTVYLTGQTGSEDFPARNAFQSQTGGGKDAFVAKLRPTQVGDSSLVYSTFVGGAGTDRGHGIAVAPDGRAYITGLTGSFNYPLRNEIDGTNEINEAFVTELNRDGGLSNSTFLGGDGQENGEDIGLDGVGNIWVTGSTTSTNFPVASPFQATRRESNDAFITKLRFDGGLGIFRGVLSSSYLGGRNGDIGRGLAVLNSRVVYVCGLTSSADLPTTPNVLKGSTNDGDGFVTRVLDTHQDSVGVFRPGSLFLIAPTIASNVTQTINFGVSGQVGVAGDWNGDGVRTVGTFSSGVWRYRNVNFVSTPATSFITVNFGLAGDIPIVGDWNGDGIETPGVFRPGTSQFFLTDSTAANPAIARVITFGINGDRPVAGDWDGDGVDSVGVFRPGQGTFLLTNQNVANPTIDTAAFFGIAGDVPVAGDWNGNGIDTVGVWRPSATTFFLSDDNVTTLPTVSFGAATDQPIVGDWDGKP